MIKISHFFTLALAGALVLAISAVAQEPSPGAKPSGTATPSPGIRGAIKGPNELVDHMRETLNLTDAQAEKIKDLIVKSREQFQALMENPKASLDDKRSQLHDAMKKGMEDIGSVLTPEQLAKWTADMKKAEAAHRQSTEAPGDKKP